MSEVDLYSQSWYEHPLIVPILNSTIGIVTAQMLISGVAEQGIGFYMSASVIGAAIYILGRIADRYSTQRVFDYIKHNPNPLGLLESNPLMKDITETSQLYTSKKNLLDYLAVIPAIVIPSIGVTAGVTSFFACFNNSGLLSRTIRINENP